MPIRPVVSSELQPFELKQQPFTGLRDMLAAQESQARLEQTRLENDKLVRSAQEDAAFSRILQETGDDWETALKRISVEAPTKGSVYMRALQEARVSGLRAEQERVKLEKAEADDGLSLLNVAIARPQLWPFIAPGFAQRVPELAPVLEQLDPAAPDFVETLKSLRQNGLLAKDAIEREDKWNQAFLEGDFRYAGEVIKQAKAEGGAALKEAKQALFGAGMTKAQIAAVEANPDAWTMTAAERSQETERREARIADDTRQQNQFVQTAAEQFRHNQATEANTRRGQNMTDARQRAQQAAESGGGALTPGDRKLVDAIIANPAIYSQLTPTVKTKLAAELAARGFSGFTDGTAGRPATGAQRRVLGFFNRAKQADDEMEKLEEEVAKMGAGDQIRLGYQGPGSNWIQTQTGQSFRQAQRAFTEARLRKDSGAAIPDHEFENDRRTYFAQPGDTAATIAQKRRARAGLLRSLAAEAGAAALREEYGEEAEPLVQGYRQRASGQAQPQQQGAQGGAAPDLTGLRPGTARRFRTGPFAGQRWTVGPDGQPKRIE